MVARWRNSVQCNCILMYKIPFFWMLLSVTASLACDTVMVWTSWKNVAQFPLFQGEFIFTSHGIFLVFLGRSFYILEVLSHFIEKHNSHYPCTWMISARSKLIITRTYCLTRVSLPILYPLYSWYRRSFGFACQCSLFTFLYRPETITNN